MQELIQTFNFNTSQVRTAIRADGEVYFCLVDVLPVLGLENRAISKFNLDDRGVEKLATPTTGGVQQVTFVNEPNLYRVIFRSNKPEARQFQDWVFNEVLPTIRKTGSYNAELTTKDTLLLDIFKASGDVNKALAINAYEEQYVKPLENKVVEQESELHIVRPKGDYFDLLVDRNLLTSFRDTAKEFCIGQKMFINFLIENKYIFRDSKGKLKPYQAHIDTGLFELKEFVNGGYTDVQTLVTPKGRETFKLLLELMLTNT